MLPTTRVTIVAAIGIARIVVKVKRVVSNHFRVHKADGPAGEGVGLSSFSGVVMPCAQFQIPIANGKNPHRQSTVVSSRASVSVPPTANIY